MLRVQKPGLCGEDLTVLNTAEAGKRCEQEAISEPNRNFPQEVNIVKKKTKCESQVFYSHLLTLSHSEM